MLAGTDDPETQGARLAAHYPLVVVKRGAAGCEAFAGERALARRRAAGRGRSTAPAPATLSSPPFSSPASPDGRSSAASPRPPPPAPRRPNSSAGSRRFAGRAVDVCISCKELGWNTRRRIPKCNAPDPCETDRHDHPPRQTRQPIPSHAGRRRRQAAARVRLRRHLRFRSVPDDGRFPQRSAERLSRRLSLASPPRHRDDHLCAGRLGRAWRQPRQFRRARRRRRAMDDRRTRHPPPGNAEGRRGRPHARLPAVGQPALQPEDDRAALPGRAERGDPRGRRRRRRLGQGDLRRVLGPEGPGRRRRRRSALSRRLSSRRASARFCRSRPTVRPSPTSSRVRRPSPALRRRSARCARSWSAARKCWCATRSAIVRWSCSTPATKSSSRRANRACASCWSPASPLREPIAWHGPIVMNTQAEIRQALTDLRDGSFIK